MSFLFIVMSDIGLPDFSGQDLGIDLDKGIFVRKGKKSDNDSNDSGNNSMNTNGSGMYVYYKVNGDGSGFPSHPGSAEGRPRVARSATRRGAF